jgi:hypothetical protein
MGLSGDVALVGHVRLLWPGWPHSEHWYTRRSSYCSVRSPAGLAQVRLLCPVWRHREHTSFLLFGGGSVGAAGSGVMVSGVSGSTGSTGVVSAISEGSVRSNG